MFRIFSTAIVLTLSLCQTIAQITTIPDAAFEQALIDEGTHTDATLNGQVLTSDVSSVLNLYILNKGIADLTGIEAFSSLEGLIAQSNELTTLDLTSNSELKFLRCYDNNLTELNLNGLDSLETILCQNNSLTTLVLNSNGALQELNCSGNDLTSLDLSQNGALLEIITSSNPLGSLDLSNLFNFLPALTFKFPH